MEVATPIVQHPKLQLPKNIASGTISSRDGFLDSSINAANVNIHLLHTQIREADWKKWLPLLLYEYRTSLISPMAQVHSKQCLDVMRLPNQVDVAFSPGSYEDNLRRKLAELYEFVDSNIVDAAAKHIEHYDSGTLDQSENNCLLQETLSGCQI